MLAKGEQMIIEIDEKSLKEVGKQILTQITMEIFSKSQENLVRPDEKGRIITDTGALLRSGVVETWGDHAKIIYKAPYADDIEFGSEPHKVPYDAIYKWCKRKLRLREDEARQVAWAVKEKIETKGTEPRSFLRNAIAEVQEKYK